MADNQVFNLKDAFRLENLITIHRERFELRYSRDQDLDAVLGKIDEGILKSELLDWAFITLIEQHQKKTEVVFLTGRHESGMPTMTSPAKIIDFNRMLVRTNSGSLYRLVGDQAETPLNVERVATIAATFNTWGIGQTLGMPPAFF